MERISRLAKIPICCSSTTHEHEPIERVISYMCEMLICDNDKHMDDKRALSRHFKVATDGRV